MFRRFTQHSVGLVTLTERTDGTSRDPRRKTYRKKEKEPNQTNNQTEHNSRRSGSHSKHNNNQNNSQGTAATVVESAASTAAATAAPTAAARAANRATAARRAGWRLCCAELARLTNEHRRDFNQLWNGFNSPKRSMPFLVVSGQCHCGARTVLPQLPQPQ